MMMREAHHHLSLIGNLIVQARWCVCPTLILFSVYYNNEWPHSFFSCPKIESEIVKLPKNITPRLCRVRYYITYSNFFGRLFTTTLLCLDEEINTYQVPGTAVFVLYRSSTQLLRIGLKHGLAYRGRGTIGRELSSVVTF